MTKFKVTNYDIDVAFFKEHDHFLYRDIDHLQVKAVLDVENSCVEPLSTLVFYLHSELHISSVALNGGGAELKVVSDLIGSRSTTFKLVKRVRIVLTDLLRPKESVRLHFSYRGWLNWCGVEDNSERFIGVSGQSVFIRGANSSPWFPHPYEDFKRDIAKSSFNLTLRCPKHLRSVGFGNLVREEETDDEYISTWQTYEGIYPNVPILYVDGWETLKSDEVYVYYLNEPRSRSAAEKYIQITSELIRFFNDHYFPAVDKKSPYFILELNVPAGGYPTQNATGFSHNSFKDILEERSKFTMFTWIGHEIVHEYIKTAVDYSEPGVPIIDDGFALYFHIPALINIFGEEYRRWILARAWKSYETKRQGGSDYEGPFPPEKPLAQITSEEYGQYKDRFLVSDKLHIVLYRLQKIVGTDRFLNAFKQYLANHRDSTASLVSFRRFMERESKMNLSEFFSRWFYSTEKLPDSWKQEDLAWLCGDAASDN